MKPEMIMNYLSMVANQNLYINGLMHVITILSIVGIYSTKSARLKKIIFNGLILFLLISVTVNAFIYGNRFHLITFAVLSVFAAKEWVMGKSQVLIPDQNTGSIFGLAFLFLGIWYPEFVKANPFLLLWISPMGVIPCPTLTVILSLYILNRNGMRVQESVLTVIIGAIYAVIGVFILKVYLDIPLLILVLYSIYSFLVRRNVHHGISH